MDMGWVPAILETGCQKIVIELQSLMTRGQGVDGGAYAPLRPATIKQKMKISAQTAPHRMLRTKDFVNHAFQYVISGLVATVSINEGLHGRELRMARKPATKAKLTEKKMHGSPAKAESYRNIKFLQQKLLFITRTEKGICCLSDELNLSIDIN